jgi:serine/threonine-protein kinase HipA
VSAASSTPARRREVGTPRRAKDLDPASAATDVELPELVDVEVADVYKAGRLAAALRREGGATVFAYHSAYLASSDARAVATTLPLTDQPVVTTHGAIPPFFAGLLPEGRRLTSLRRAVKTSADDELSLLMAVGADPVGDVQVVPAGRERGAVDPLLVVERSFDEVRFGDLLHRAGVVDPVALAGVHDKVSARMISVPVAASGHRYILKIEPPEYSHLAENEHYFAGMAASVRFPVVRTHIVRDATGRAGLLVERFDRVIGADGEPLALAVEDAAQVLGLYPSQKYGITAEAAVRALADACAARPVAAAALFRQLVFAWLTGNGDVHAKNLSILATPGGEWRVSPAYDVPSTLPYRDYTMALSMGGRRDGLSRRLLLDFATATGVPSRMATRVLDEVLSATEGLADGLDAGALPYAPQITRRVSAALRHRWRAAEG